MELLPNEIRRSLPALYSQKSNPDPVAQIRFFFPLTDCVWYATEGSPLDATGAVIADEADQEREADFLLFGLVTMSEMELGYFSLRDLSAVEFGGLKIERDLFWTPCALSKIRNRRL